MAKIKNIVSVTLAVILSVVVIFLMMAEPFWWAV